MKTDDTLRMCVEKIDLSLQLVRRGEVVVAIEIGDVFAAASAQSSQVIYLARKPDATIAIGFRRIAQQHTDLLRMLLAELDYDVPGAIARSVFADNDLVSKVHLLQQDTIHCL